MAERSVAPDRGVELGRGVTLDPAAAAAHGAAVVGGKAWNLGRLVAAGVEVPPFLVVPADVELTAESRAAIRFALATAGLGDALLAVRSSAAAEDSASASFAGQLETVLGVPAGSDDLWDAIAAVRASGASERVRAYAGAAAPAVAVILQALVDAEAAGVAFSVDPVSGDRSLAVVSAVVGLGEALVSGEVDADAYRVGRDGAVTDRAIVAKDRALRRAAAGTEWRQVPPAEREAPALSDGEAAEVAAAARRLESALGGPQDIEWAYVAGTAGDVGDRVAGAPARRLVILQARPITTLPTGERRIWDNSNIIESYAGVTTPLTFSFARAVYEDVYRQFCAVMGVEDALIEKNRAVFAGMIGSIRGRIYYNLLNWYRLLALLPGYAFNRAFMERMMGVREKLDDPPAPQLVTGRWRDLGRLLKAVGGIVRESRRLRRSVPAFHARVDAALLPLADEDLTRRTSDDLLALYRRLEDDLLRHWQPPLVNDFFAMIWFGVLGRLVEGWLPGQPPTLVNDLLSGEGGMISTEPARSLMGAARRVADAPDVAALFQREPDDDAVWLALGEADPGSAAAALRADLDAYIRRFGDRCANELKLETVTLAERPGFVVGVVRSYWRQGATDPDASREREARIRREAEATVRGALGPVRRRVFFAVLRRARARIRDRENLRFERTRVFGVVRRIFLAFGRRLTDAGRIAEPRDVFWLTTDEVFGWADGTVPAVDLAATVAVRRAEYDRYRETTPPPERFETVGSPAEAIAARVSAGPAEPADRSGPEFGGTGCCPGVVRAPVRVVRDPSEAGDLSGKILVAERTDPGWTLLFPAASGLLVQRGSLLSHSAIVAREVGLPCIVSIPGLMELVEEGEVVEMDGATGRVRRVGRDAAAGPLDVAGTADAAGAS